jgi:hypothetical protein
MKMFPVITIFTLRATAFVHSLRYQGIAVAKYSCTLECLDNGQMQSCYSLSANRN